MDLKINSTNDFPFSQGWRNANHVLETHTSWTRWMAKSTIATAARSQRHTLTLCFVEWEHSVDRASFVGWFVRPNQINKAPFRYMYQVAVVLVVRNVAFFQKISNQHPFRGTLCRIYVLEGVPVRIWILTWRVGEHNGLLMSRESIPTNLVLRYFRYSTMKILSDVRHTQLENACKTYGPMYTSNQTPPLCTAWRSPSKRLAAVGTFSSCSEVLRMLVWIHVLDTPEPCEWYERWQWYWCTGTLFKFISNFSRFCIHTQIYVYAWVPQNRL